MASRGIETRERLVQTALRLFRDVGFQATTMRRIADEAGVSLGNAYYYFDSKDELVHELYLAIQREHRDRVLPALRQGAPLEENLRIVLHAGLDVMGPYHDFGASFVQTALPTSSRTSPFSTESGEARTMAVELIGLAVAASNQRVSSALAPELPTLLWLVYLAVTLQWVADSSSEQLRTRVLVDGLVPIIAKAITMSRLPMARGLVQDVLALVSALGAVDAETVSR
jgi:AcrR family transcriptional regulator